MLFSIVIPVYNAETFLRPCLDSVLNQTESDWECICVDDGSQDASGRILDEYAVRDPRFRVIHQVNQGVGAARNVGLASARGDWITWLDADDLYHPGRLSEVRRLIESENPDLVRFGFYMGRAGESGFPDKWQLRRGFEVFQGALAKEWGWRVFAPGGMVWTWAARRELLSGVQFPENMRTKEDSIFCARLCTRLEKVVQSECAPYFYRWVGTSAMHRTRRADDCIRLLTEVRDLFRSPACSQEGLDGRVCKAMVCWLRAHAESDIIDWIRMRDGERNRNGEILSHYRELRKVGLCDCLMCLQRRMRVPFWWWSCTGQSWPISLTFRLAAVARMLFRRGGKRRD